MMDTRRGFSKMALLTHPHTLHVRFACDLLGRAPHTCRIRACSRTATPSKCSARAQRIHRYLANGTTSQSAWAARYKQTNQQSLGDKLNRLLFYPGRCDWPHPGDSLHHTGTETSHPCSRKCHSNIYRRPSTHPHLWNSMQEQENLLIPTLHEAGHGKIPYRITVTSHQREPTSYYIQNWAKVWGNYVHSLKSFFSGCDTVSFW